RSVLLRTGQDQPKRYNLTRRPIGTPQKAFPTVGFEKMTAMAFSPDGRLLATDGADGVVYLWDARGGLLERKLKRPDWAARSIAGVEPVVSAQMRSLVFAPDGKLLATA